MTIAFIFLYAGIALMDLSADGAICYAHKRKFNLSRALAAAILWPITAPLAIYGAFKLTQDNEPW